MWVVDWRDRVGIINRFIQHEEIPAEADAVEKLPALTCAEIHLVNEDGSTYCVLPTIPISMIRQAKYDEIPLPRRPTEDVARRFGYL